MDVGTRAGGQSVQQEYGRHGRPAAQPVSRGSSSPRPAASSRNGGASRDLPTNLISSSTVANTAAA